MELAFQQISELLPVPGIAHITPLPADLQKVAAFGVGVAATCPDAALARQVITFLASREAAPTIAKTGMEPLAAA